MFLDLTLAIVVNIVEKFNASLLSLLPLLVLLRLLLLSLDVDELIQLLLVVHHIVSSVLKAGEGLSGFFSKFVLLVLFELDELFFLL